MREPVPCPNCPECHMATVVAIRTAQHLNQCHCTNCGHVWYEEPAETAEPAIAHVRLKPDRRSTGEW